MPSKSKFPKDKAVKPEVPAPPRQKHTGALGDAMRKGLNTKRMDAVRAYKAK